ncbi:hypothetical protein [Curtobacterium sp. KBS0715]|uniref:hypothetical protein n=1 Tax=Curtobacterium sp. KBS0715 TaxID=1179671 RepID=UPI00163D5AC8|nr:hypothetical protein [Curtobacterium sp. KBS0715]
MEPAAARSHPSPTAEGWLFVEPVSPSTLCESYASAMLGLGPAGGAGAVIGYCQVKSPVCADTSHDPDSFMDVAEKLPEPLLDAVALVAARVTVRAASIGVRTTLFAEVNVATGTAAAAEYGLSPSSCTQRVRCA